MIVVRVRPSVIAVACPLQLCPFRGAFFLFGIRVMCTSNDSNEVQYERHYYTQNR